MFTHHQLIVLLSCVQYAYRQFTESSGEINPSNLDSFEYERTLGNLLKKLDYLQCMPTDDRTILLEELDRRMEDWSDLIRSFPSDRAVADKRITALETLKNYLIFHA